MRFAEEHEGKGGHNQEKDHEAVLGLPLFHFPTLSMGEALGQARRTRPMSSTTSPRRSPSADSASWPAAWTRTR